MNWKDYTISFLKSAKLIINLSLLVLLLGAEIFAQPEQEIVSDIQNTDTTTFMMKKSPWGAVLRSAIIPGLGQIYNESYWKAPIVWGTLIYLADAWIRNDKNYNKYQNLYIEGGTNNSIYLEWRDFYRDQRDSFAIYLGLAYLLNLVDAYVDAHLFDFSVSENPNNNAYQLSLRIKL